MKVLLLDQFSDPGGAQSMLLDLLPAIRARGWCAAVGLPAGGDVNARVRALGFETFAIECGPYSSSRKTPGDLRRFISELPRLSRQIRNLAAHWEPDVIHINGPRLLPAAASAHLARPVLFHAHIGVAQRTARLVAGLSLWRLDAHVVAVCQSVAASWRPFAKGGQVRVVYNGVAGPENIKRRDTGPPRIGCIGRIAPEKGQREFVAAAARIHAALPEAQFSVHGAALFSDQASVRYEQQVREAAAGLPVEFPGWAGDVYAAMAQLDLLLVPSVWPEPNPRVVLEAFAAGLPVIAFRTGGLPEVIEDGRTGFLCDGVRDAAQAAIDLLQGEPARLRSVAAAARQSWCERFTLQRWQQRMLAEIEAACRPFPAAPAN